MKVIINSVLLISMQFTFFSCSGRNDDPPVNLPITGGQIVADHTVVERFDDIPQQYIDEVKKMWLVYAGESHSAALRTGLSALEKIDPKYAVSIKESGTPEAYTASNTRVSRATWGDVNSATGWIYSYGEEDWYKTEASLERTKAGLTYCNTNNLEIAAFGFGHCYGDGGDNYLNATQIYNDYCITSGYRTKVFFTTGPVDDPGYMNSQLGYNTFLRWNSIRNYVRADETLMLFDYADILCYDNDGSMTTGNWNGNSYPSITPTNLNPVATGHISSAGALRLAKAMWWMLARIAGWDGN